MVAHASLTGAELHEPKGIEGAVDRQVYIADGAGSGAWEAPTASDIQVVDSSNFFTATNVEEVLEELYGREFYFYDRIADVSTPSFVLIPILENSVVNSIRFVLGGAITTADSTLTITRGGDGASLGTRVIAFSGSAEGTTFDFTPTGNNSLDATTHRYLKIATDGNSSTAQPLYFTISETRV